ncbi:MAG: RecX family transcriptional regulator, partial [Fimbriimonas ginsengisoli]|nr:RecX family transcriptional regulator [Fimbriimonas ginsengisoli]
VESAVARSEGRSAKGCEALRDALVAREAPPALIDEALAALEPEPIRARRALEAAPSSTRAKRTRADRYLASRAFDGESISSALEAMGLGSATES